VKNRQVVPVYVFGQNDCYGYWRLGPPLVPSRWVEALARRVGAAPLLLWGHRGSFVPKPVKLTVVVGRPMQLGRTTTGGAEGAGPEGAQEAAAAGAGAAVEPPAQGAQEAAAAAAAGAAGAGAGEEPSAEVVQQYLSRFIEEMRGLYERHKGKTEFAGRALEVL
jgi:hypothetical protein